MVTCVGILYIFLNKASNQWNLLLQDEAENLMTFPFEHVISKIWLNPARDL